MVILSAIFSDFPDISLYGFVERKEGLWVVLCYIALMFSAINLVDSRMQIKAVIYSFGLSGGLISLIGIFQYIGKDIFASDKMKSIIIPAEILSRVEQFNITMGEKYAYSVFYNPNYLGGYISFYAPLMLGMAIYQRKFVEKYIFLLFAILSLFTLFSSRSEAGVLGIAVTGPLIIIAFMIRKLYTNKGEGVKKSKIIMSALSISAAFIILPFFLSFVPIEENPFHKIRKEIVQGFKLNDKEIDFKAIGPINNIERINDSTIEITIQNTPTRIIASNTVLKITVEDDLIYQNTIEEMNDNEYGHVSGLDKYYKAGVMINKTSASEIYGIGFYLQDYGTTLYFLHKDNNLYITDSSYRILDIARDFGVAPYIGLEGKGMLGSGRGYIWSRSIPVVLDNLIIGTGQDTFITQFPQYDIYGKQAELELYYLWTLTDKPHSLYLQIAIHSGLISLLILLTGFVLLTYRSFKLSIHEHNIAFIINIALIGFMVSSLFNDSILAITPIVYVLIGLNVACILNQNNEKAV